MAKRWKVVSRFFDAARGDYVDPGQAWTPVDQAQADRYVKAGCLQELAGDGGGSSGGDGGGGPPASSQALSRLKREDLMALCLERGIEVAEDATKKDLVAALGAAAGK